MREFILKHNSIAKRPNRFFLFKLKFEIFNINQRTTLHIKVKLTNDLCYCVV